MAVLTAVYVIATLWIVHESRRNNRLMSLFEKDRMRPHVIFWVEPEMRTLGEQFSMIEFVGKVRNEGASTAHDIKITTTPKIIARQSIDRDDDEKLYTPTFLEKPTSILVPKQVLVENIGPTKFLLEDNDDDSLKFNVLIEYKDAAGTIYSSTYKIDLSRNKSQTFPEDKQAKAYFTLVENIGSVARSLEEINRTLNQPDRSNIFAKEKGLELNQRQIELLRQIVDSEKNLENDGETWHLSEIIGQNSIGRESSNGPIKLDAETRDIQTLCQAGHLRGYYSDDVLWFYVSPSADSELKNIENGEQIAIQGKST